MTNYAEKHLDKQDAAEIKNYTRIPNMLIFGYHETISPQEKWLYVCLKHMCGRSGTRHLSLRYISEQTGISVGALSKSKHSEGMIKHLHDAGLIHAEIKKHEGKGNPQFHITITDVWGLNQDFFASRPKFGQVHGEETEVSEFRTDLSEIRTGSEETRSDFGQACPNFDTNIRLDNKTTESNKITEQESTLSAVAALPTISPDGERTHAFLSSSQQERKPDHDTPTLPDSPAVPESAALVSVRDAAGSQEKQPGVDTPSLIATETTTPTEPTKEKAARKPRAPKPAANVQEDEAALERRRGIYERIVARRGYELEGKERINEHVYVKKLAEKLTDVQIEAIHKYLFERDWKWSKVDNKFKIGAYIIWKEAENVAQILKAERMRGKGASASESGEVAVGNSFATMTQEEFAKEFYPVKSIDRKTNRLAKQEQDAANISPFPQTSKERSTSYAAAW